MRSGGAWPRLAFLENPGLVRYWIWPILITAASFGLVITAIVLWHDDLLGLLWARCSTRCWDPA